tara:strand:- start:10567 stop:11832 length:1266 start_codon:yes stop_codon:yes gene_type:complete
MGSVLSGFLIVPLTMDYLDNENYGVWLTLSSFIGWFSFFDIGLGHGLRNKFAEARAKGEFQLAKAYVSCAYYTIGLVSLILVILFFLCNFFINWSSIFNTTSELDYDLGILMPIVFVFFSLQLVVKLVTTIYIADQHHSTFHKIEFATRGLSLLMVWILLNYYQSSLLVYGAIFSSIPVVVLLIFNFIAFSTTYVHFKPSLSFFKLKYLKEITGVGMNFFIIQIAVMVLMSTDNFIITQIFSPADVVPYNVAQKYFSVLFIAHTLLVTPYWSSMTEAYINNDINWIRNSVRNVQRIWLLIPVCLVVMVFSANWFYNQWVGEDVIVPIGLSISMALFVLLMTYQSIYVQFLNGTGKIRLQTYLSIFTLLINIPLSIFLAKTLNFGLSGVILATCFSLFITLIFYPIQYKKIITNKAKGIWNK